MGGMTGWSAIPRPVGFQPTLDGWVERNRTEQASLHAASMRPEPDNEWHVDPAHVLVPRLEPYEMNYVMEPGAILKGRVHRPDGTPYTQDFSVKWKGQPARWDAFITLRPDKDGLFRCAAPPGEVWLTRDSDVSCGPLTVKAPDEYELDVSFDENAKPQTLTCKRILEGQGGQPGAGAVGAKDTTILPGRGLKEIGVGDTDKAVRERFGEPEKITPRLLSYKDSHGLEFAIQNNHVAAMLFTAPFSGKTADGIGFSSRIEDAVKASGGDNKFVKADQMEFLNMTDGTDRVFYTMYYLPEGGSAVSQFVDQARGILYWADSDGKIGQIRTFDPALPPVQDYPTTVIAFGPKKGSMITNAEALQGEFYDHIPAGDCRVHHIAPGTANGRSIGLICADNAPPVEQMLRDSGKLACLGTCEIKDKADFDRYCATPAEQFIKKYMSDSGKILEAVSNNTVSRGIDCVVRKDDILVTTPERACAALDSGEQPA
jgi:hypothetical protein